MDNDDVFKFLSASGSDKKKRDKIREATDGNQDNRSAYILHIQDVILEPNDERRMVNEETTARCNALNMKPVDKNVVIQDEDPVDDDATILSSSPRTQSRKLIPKKKPLTWLWWAILIAAIVAVAAWMSLYTFTGKRGHGDSNQQVEVTKVQEVKPIKPIPHPNLQQENTGTARRNHQATNNEQTSNQVQQKGSNDEPVAQGTPTGGNED